MRYGLIALSLALLLSAHFSTAREIPNRLGDDAFWRMAESFSEESKPWDSFYTSNEFNYAAGVARLVSSRIQGGVYIGVGAEQNFSYIAAVRPKMAFVVDIRRENALEQLMYKAIFEISPTRSAFVSRLLSRVEVAAGPQARVEDLFRSLGNVHPGLSSKTSQEIRTQLTQVHGFRLSGADLDSIDRMRDWIANHLVTYLELMESADENAVQRSYLASEENYQTVRNLQLQNLVVPVTGDFSGTKALTSIAGYITSSGSKTTVFYTSNVEGSLAGDAWRQFYTNIALLPFDSESVILRAISDGQRFVLTPCHAQELVNGFKNNTRQNFDPRC